MSNAELARRSSVQVSFAGTDITNSITPYLLSLVYTDNEENEADDLQIRLQDREDVWLTSWLNEAIDAASSPANHSEVSHDTTTATYKVNAQSGLNIRSGPGTNYSRYGTLPYGTVVSITGSTGEWSSFTYNGKTAYLYTQYLTPTNTNANSMPTVQFGSSGTAVKTLQQHLLSLGYELPRFGDDSYFGSETKEAVMSFQEDKGLSRDGICGPSTWEAIFAAINTSTVTQTVVDKMGLSISAVIVYQNANSDGKDRILDCGQFELDSVDASGPPSVITIKATALPFTSRIRQTKKTKAWESYNLSGIADEMASANGMSCMYLANNNPFYQRVEQYATSDISFLQTLAHSAGLSLKVTNNIIVLFDQASYESNGSVLTIRRGDKSYTQWKVGTSEADTHYTSCRVRWTTTDGSLIEGIANVEDYDADSKTNQQLEIRAKVSSATEANSLAAKLLRKHNKFQKTATFTMPGNPALVAGLTVQLERWGSWSGKYIISQARHSVSGSYTTQIKLRMVLEGY